jgi:biotin carboxylase
MERALGETRIDGVKTTVAICREILASDDFRAGGVGVGWLPAFLGRRAAV